MGISFSKDLLMQEMAHFHTINIFAYALYTALVLTYKFR